jgi:riboflavin biosynthesis pyrimidine reductase
LSQAPVDYTTLDLPRPPRDRPYVLLNMVMSADGKVVVEGTEKGIGSKFDQRLMRELRTNADVVLNGATTLRKSGASPRLGDRGLEEVRLSRGKGRMPIGSILSRSGRLPLDAPFFTAKDFRGIVYLSDAAAKARQRSAEGTGREVVLLPAAEEVPAMLRHMRRELEAEVLLLEGGPTVNAEFFALGAIDEYFLTLGPVIVGGKDSITAVEGAEAFTRETLKKLKLVSAVPNPETNEVYLHYRVRR